MTFTIGEFVGILVGVVTFIGGIAATIVWAYSTFITRTEAAKMEHAVDRIIAAFKTPIYDRLDKFENKLDKHLEAHH